MRTDKAKEKDMRNYYSNHIFLAFALTNPLFWAVALAAMAVLSILVVLAAVVLALGILGATGYLLVVGVKRELFPPRQQQEEPRHIPVAAMPTESVVVSVAANKVAHEDLPRPENNEPAPALEALNEVQLLELARDRKVKGANKRWSRARLIERLK